MRKAQGLNHCKALPHLKLTCFFLLDASHSAPVVIKCLRERVSKCTSGLLVHMVSMVLRWQASADTVVEQNKWDIPKCLLAIIPKEWNYTHALKEKDKCKIILPINKLARFDFRCVYKY